MIELGFYGSLLFSVASDVKRKVSDFNFGAFQETQSLSWLFNQLDA